MAYQTSFMRHCKAIEECLPRFNAVASISIPSYQMRVHARNRYYDLVAQFVHRKKGQLEYTVGMPADMDGLGFIGWLPYFNKRWRAAGEKFAFKKFCSENGLRVPRYSIQAADGLGDYIIKQNVSSFGQGIRGPFRNLGQTQPQSSIGENEYYEEFISGKILKAWYWDDKPVCLEVLPMPTVIGNGVQSLHQLVENAVSSQPGLERAGLEALARYQDVAWDEPIPAGKAVLADFRYASPLFAASLRNQNVMAQHASSDLGRQLAEAGPLLWRAIPENRRDATLYTVDAIMDGEGQVWFLEMNSNPTVHPDAYFTMFEHLFGPAQSDMPQRMPAATASAPEAAPPPQDSSRPPRGMPPTNLIPPRMRPLAPVRGVPPAAPIPPAAPPLKQS